MEEENEFLVAAGGAVKSLGDGKFEGQLVRFGSPEETDLGGEYFDASTDFGVKDGDPITLYYKHGKNRDVGKKAVGRGQLRIDDAGIFLQGEIAQRDAYEKAIYELARKGKLGLSSGAAAHLIEREPVGKSVHIKQWQLAEASLTTIPYEWRSIVSAKSLPDDDDALKALVMAATNTPEAGPEALSGAEHAVQTSKADNVRTGTHSIEVKDMAEQNAPAPESKEAGQDNEALKSLNAKLQAQGDQISQLLKLIEDSPAIRKTGYYSVDGGASDPNVKSFGDFLLAVQRHDETRIRKVYGSTKDATKDVDSTTGASGSYLVPDEFQARLLTINPFETPLLSRVTRIPVTAPAGSIPALDVFTAVTAGSGDTAAAGRVTTAPRAQGGAYTETQPQFEEIRWQLNDAASGYIEVTKEMRTDSAIAIEALLQARIRVAVNSNLEYFLWQGTGVGQPLGVLNAPALVAVDADTNDAVVFADIAEMYSRFKAMSGGMPMWVIHPSAIPDFASLMVASSTTAYVNDISRGIPPTLMGYPVYMCEHLAQTNNPYDIALVEPESYVLFEKGGLYVDFSEHVGFLSGKDTWRFGRRVDGQPWLKSAITLADSTGSFTVSPFVANND